MDGKRKLNEEAEMLACPVCFEDYQTSGNQVPRIFPCSHTICQKCVESIISGTEFVCPICRKKFETEIGTMPGLENSYIMNTLKILARNKEERFQLCKEHRRELSLFCKGNQCGKVICQLCHLESHDGHNVVDVVKEHQKNIDKRLCYVIKRKSEQTRHYLKDRSCLHRLHKMQKCNLEKYSYMSDSMIANMGREKINIDDVHKEMKTLVEMKKKVEETGRASDKEIEFVRNQMGKEIPINASKNSLNRKVALSKNHDISLFSIPANRQGK